MLNKHSSIGFHFSDGSTTTIASKVALIFHEVKVDSFAFLIELRAKERRLLPSSRIFASYIFSKFIEEIAIDLRLEVHL